MQNQDEPELQDSEKIKGCGYTLSQARKQQQRTIEEISRKLNLSVSQIKAIELDRSDNLPEPAYVRGYIRSYAKLLGLNQDEILEYYQNASRGVQQGDWNDSQRQLSDYRSKTTGRFSAANVIAFLVGVISMAFLLYSGMVPNPFFDKNDNDKKTMIAVPAKQKTEQTVLATKTKTTSSMQRTEKVAVSEATGKGGETLKSASTNNLKMQFTDSSWVDIRDADNKRLIYKTYVAGEQLQVSSETSMSVLLGTAANVKVQYNDEPFDLREHTEDVYAKFVVGEGE